MKKINDLKTLQGMKPLVELLGHGGEPTKQLYWLVSDETGEESSSYYCYECAQKILVWLRGGEQPANIQPHQEHPKWTGCDEENCYAATPGGGYESDIPLLCELCGSLLDCAYLDGAAEYEIDHWEGCLAEHRAGRAPLSLTPDDWIALAPVIEAIEYVERPDYPSRWDDPDRVRCNQELYRRTVAAIRDMLIIATPANLARAWQRGYRAYPGQAKIKDERVGDFWEAGWLAAELADMDGIEV